MPLIVQQQNILCIIVFLLLAVYELCFAPNACHVHRICCHAQHVPGMLLSLCCLSQSELFSFMHGLFGVVCNLFAAARNVFIINNDDVIRQLSAAICI